jgi:hypothetical protein
MSTLPKELRSKLEKAVLAAREVATQGADAAFTSLGLADGKKPAHLDGEGEALRRRLRARGRQVGDLRRGDDSQETTKLVQECAYEHWHRMLFARYLAENDLLRHPDMGVSIALEECEELAREEGIDLWELAARYAQQMLPGIFRLDDPVLQLRLPTETRLELTRILNALPQEIFTAEDSLGWTYQFWQTKRKKEVNESGVKIGADELSPVTQLFTEDYMVDFLLDNTLGAWHAGKLLATNPQLAENAQSEDELRQFAALPGCPWKYLRFIRNENGNWSVAAGTFDGWPKTAKELTCLDPCMGSGHFVVAIFQRMAALRMTEEDLSETAAVEAVIRDNLFGLEIDPRCTQIAAFNLALAAWHRVGYCPLPAMNLACSGLAPNTREADWLSIAGNNEKLQRGMKRLYRLFEKAAILGSLINPRAEEGDLLVAAFHELQPLLEKALAQETKDDAEHEMAVTARGLAKAAEILAGQFTLVATNVPYLGRLKQSEEIRDYCERVYPDSKADLATCFVDRCSAFCSPGGSTALVTPQNWLFLGTFQNLREILLKTKSWNVVVQLGEEAWRSFGMRGPRTVLMVLTETKPQISNHFFGIDVSTNRAEQPILLEEKAARLADSLPMTIKRVSQQAQFGNPDATIVFEPASGVTLLSKYADSFQGSGLADIVKYRRLFWEIEQCHKDWVLHQSSPDGASHFSGLHFAVYWQDGRGDLVNEPEVTIRGRNAWKKLGVACAWLGSLPTGLYLGTLYDNSAAAIIPKDPNHVAAVWCFCSSPSYLQEVRKINHKPQVANAALVKVPFNLAHWQKVAAEKYPHGLPKPFSSDPTQWLFTGHPTGAEQPLHVAVARLLGYQWPRQTGSSFSDCPALDPDGFERFADADGIVCLTSLRGESNAADRLRELLNAALGSFDERALLASAGNKGSRSATLGDWLRDEFFEQHCDLFHQRPFLWHIWDGRKDGFNALVNYHKLAAPNGAGRRTLEALAHGYLGDWITRQKDDVANKAAGADDRLAAALELQGLLERILAGEPPYDLFIRWKPLHQQPIGWEPDINDGVRLNARPFLATDLSRGKKGAGLFRAKFNVKWDKDRGKEPRRAKEDFPWFWNWDEKTQNFTGTGKEPDGNRWNDLHYTTAFRQAAREVQNSQPKGNLS